MDDAVVQPSVFFREGLVPDLEMVSKQGAPWSKDRLSGQAS